MISGPESEYSNETREFVWHDVENHVFLVFGSKRGSFWGLGQNHDPPPLKFVRGGIMVFEIFEIFEILEIFGNLGRTSDSEVRSVY